MAHPSRYVFDFLKNGEDVDMDVNGSVTAVNFDYTVPSNRFLELYKLSAVILDGGVQWDRFGGLAELSNGLQVLILDENGTTIADITDTQNIKKNADFGFLSGTRVLSEPAAGDDALIGDIRLSESGRPPMLLEPNHVIRVVVQDDLTALTSFRVSVHALLVGTRFDSVRSRD